MFLYKYHSYLINLRLDLCSIVFTFGSWGGAL